MALQAFSDEQARALINLEQRYQVWMEAEQILQALPYDLRRKQIGGRAYLYEIADRGGNGKSLGPLSTENEAKFADYHRRKTEAKARRDASRPLLEESGRLCRALRTLMLASVAGAIARKCDRRRLMGRRLLVVGTCALPAYAVEAGGLLHDAPGETEDFDLAWVDENPDAAGEPALWPMLKAVDPTFTVDMERAFQARNAKAYEVAHHALGDDVAKVRAR